MRRNLCTSRSTHLLYNPFQSYKSFYPSIHSFYLNHLVTYSLNYTQKKFFQVSNLFKQTIAGSSQNTKESKRHSITLIPGEGIGRELIHEAQRIIDAAGVVIDYDEQEFDGASSRQGNVLPEKMEESIRRNKAALIGPFLPAIGKKCRPANNILNQKLKLFVNVLRVRSLPGVELKSKETDLIIVQENQNDLHNEIEDIGPGLGLKRIRCERLCDNAYRIAAILNRKRITLVHNRPFETVSERLLFLAAFPKIAKCYPEIETSEVALGTWATSMLHDSNPNKSDVIVTGKSCGSLLSEAAGSLGFIPCANMDEEVAVFGTTGKFGPNSQEWMEISTAFFQSAAMMLKLKGEDKAADRMDQAIYKVYEITRRLKPNQEGEAKISDFAADIRSAMRKLQ